MSVAAQLARCALALSRIYPHGRPAQRLGRNPSLSRTSRPRPASGGAPLATESPWETRNVTAEKRCLKLSKAMRIGRPISFREHQRSRPGGRDHRRRARLPAPGRREAAHRHCPGHPGILIPDEATSRVDTAMERTIHEAIERLSRGRTVVACHRLPADIILVTDDGELVDSGRHEELLARGGLYAQPTPASSRPETARWLASLPSGYAKLGCGCGPGTPN